MATNSDAIGVVISSVPVPSYEKLTEEEEEPGENRDRVREKSANFFALYKRTVF